MHTLIAASKEAAKIFVGFHTTEAGLEDPARVTLFSDGSLIPGEGVGAVEIHLPTKTIITANLGNPTHHTVYKAELVGLRMAANSALLNYAHPQDAFWFFVDNQLLTRDLSQRLCTTPGLSLQ